MKYFISIILSLSILVCAKAQEHNNRIYEPEFPGGDHALAEWISQHIIPEQFISKDSCICLSVAIELDIHGKIIKAECQSGLILLEDHKGVLSFMHGTENTVAEEAVLRVLKNSPEWVIPEQEKTWRRVWNHTFRIEIDKNSDVYIYRYPKLRPEHSSQFSKDLKKAMNKALAEIGEDIPYARVYVSFVVDKDGSITGTRVLRSTHDTLSKAGTEFLSSIPNWYPALKNDEPVMMKVSLPIVIY